MQADGQSGPTSNLAYVYATRNRVSGRAAPVFGRFGLWASVLRPLARLLEPKTELGAIASSKVSAERNEQSKRTLRPPPKSLFHP